MTARLRLLVVDDHFLVRIGLTTTLRLAPDFHLVGEASTGKQALELYRALLPDVVMLDLRLPDLSGLEVARRLRAEFPDARILVISTFDTEYEVYRAFREGVQGYVLKSVQSEELFDAIRTVAANGHYFPTAIRQRLSAHRPEQELTAREFEVLQLIVKGLGNREIGQLLGFSENTAKFHVKGILSKLDASDRTEAAAAAIERGLVQESYPANTPRPAD